MVIKKWNATNNEWTPLSPKVTYTDIVDSVSATTPEAIFESGKLRSSYLPDFIFGGMRFLDTLESSGFGLSLIADKLHSAYLAYGQDSLNGLIGKYLVAGATLFFQVPTSTQKQEKGEGTSSNPTKYYLWQSQQANSSGVELEEDDSGGQDFTIEAGDWLVITGVTGAGSSASPYVFSFSVVNNTYQVASSSTAGIVKVGYTTDNANRNYAVQLDANKKAYVNVGWTDNTFRTVTAGGNTLDATETLAFTAGDNVSISEDAGAVTINATDTRREIKLGGTQKIASSATTALDIVVGNNMSITESNGAFTFNSSHPNISASGDLTASSRTYVTSLDLDSNGHILSIGTGTETVTDTTYTAGNGIALSGSNQFSVTGGIGLTTEASGLKMTYPVYHGNTLPDLSSVSGVDNVIGFEW